MRPSAVVLGVVGLLAAGAGAGWGASTVIHSGPREQKATLRREVVVEHDRPQSSSSVDMAQLTAQMRLLVREELSNLELDSACEHETGESNEQPKAGKADEALEVEQDVALNTALGIVDSAIAGGDWTADESQDVRALWSSLDQARKSQVLSRLFGAFNDGSLRPTTHGPPI